MADINPFDPQVWLIAAALVVIITFIAIYFKVILGSGRPHS